MSIGSVIRRAVGSYNATKTTRTRTRRRPIRGRSTESQLAGGLFRMLRRKT